MHIASKNIAQLHHDLRNGPYHVFNEHSRCSPSFCKVAANVTEATSSNAATPPVSAQASDVASTLDNITSQEIEG